MNLAPAKGYHGVKANEALLWEHYAVVAWWAVGMFPYHMLSAHKAVVVGVFKQPEDDGEELRRDPEELDELSLRTVAVRYQKTERYLVDAGYPAGTCAAGDKNYERFLKELDAASSSYRILIKKLSHEEYLYFDHWDEEKWGDYHCHVQPVDKQMHPLEETEIPPSKCR